MKFYWYQIGRGDFLHSFFSTVAYNLEDKKWGNRFPVIMNHLYQGKVAIEEVDKAIEELAIIREELKELSIDKVIWDIDDISQKPPWGSDVCEDITNLSNYFVTSDGEDFISILFHALEMAKEVKSDIEIKSI